MTKKITLTILIIAALLVAIYKWIMSSDDNEETVQETTEEVKEEPANNAYIILFMSRRYARAVPFFGTLCNICVLRCIWFTRGTFGCIMYVQAVFSRGTPRLYKPCGCLAALCVG